MRTYLPKTVTVHEPMLEETKTIEKRKVLSLSNCECMIMGVINSQLIREISEYISCMDNEAIGIYKNDFNDTYFDEF